MCNAEERSKACVNVDNVYIFPSTKSSANHINGWNATATTCRKANLSMVTPTSRRIRLSTKYAALDIPNCDRQHWYKHLGHTEQVNKGMYQRPLANLVTEKAGKHLYKLDAGKFYLKCYSELPTTPELQEFTPEVVS